MKTSYLHFNIKAAVNPNRLETTVELIARIVLLLGILFMVCTAAHGSTYPQDSLVMTSTDLERDNTYSCTLSNADVAFPLSLDPINNQEIDTDDVSSKAARIGSYPLPEPQTLALLVLGSAGWMMPLVRYQKRAMVH